jgi:hypothetical protein
MGERVYLVRHPRKHLVRKGGGEKEKIRKLKSNLLSRQPSALMEPHFIGALRGEVYVEYTLELYRVGKMEAFLTFFLKKKIH